jgi:hypothetical protein
MDRVVVAHRRERVGETALPFRVEIGARREHAVIVGRQGPFEATSTCSPFLVRSGVSVFEAARALTVGEIGALSDLDNITVRVADLAARLHGG